MARQSVVEQCLDLRKDGRANNRAPHKPLLMLLLLADLQHGGDGALSFSEIEKPLRDLLDAYGRPMRGRQQPELPFWHLASDPPYEIRAAEGLQFSRSPSGKRPRPTLSSLRSVDPVGALRQDIVDQFRAESEELAAIARRLLEDQFPASLHDEIALAIGIDLGQGAPAGRRIRDPKFRHDVLLAYGYRCAVCGTGIRMEQAAIGLEAAHIHWHTARGPDRIDNGICLCALHHRLFDRGAFTLDDRRGIKISPLANGPGCSEHLLRYSGDQITPERDEYAPAAKYTRWHVKEVFKPGYAA